MLADLPGPVAFVNGVLNMSSRDVLYGVHLHSRMHRVRVTGDSKDVTSPED